MVEFKSLLVLLADPRLAAHATSRNPAWLWSADAAHILWANPAGAAIFNASSPAALAGSTIDPKGTAALQIARIAGTLPHGAAPRLERLRGFGGRLGGALLCACSRLILADGSPAILVASTERIGPDLTIEETARRLLEGCTEPAALFASDGRLLHGTPSALIQFGRAITLSALGAAPLGGEALAAGRAAGDSSAGRIVLERIGADAAAVLMATLDAPSAAATDVPETPVVAHEPPPAPAEPPAVAPEPVPDTPPQAVAPVDADWDQLTQDLSGEPPVAAAPGESAETAEPEQPAPEAPPRSPEPSPAPPQASEPPRTERRLPLRFVWQMDVDSRFTLDSGEFVALIGPQTASVLGRPWDKIAAALGIDPEGQVLRAFTSRDTWSGITVAIPADGTGERLPVELSGLPVFDRDRSFRGYRGFGICRDIAKLAALAHLRGGEAPPAAPPPARHEPPMFRDERPALTVVPPSVNVVPFRSAAPEKSPTLTPVERKAFNELADRLTARLRSADPPDGTALPAAEEPSPPLAPERPQPPHREPQAETRGLNGDHRPILDRLPVGVLVYRLDKLIYANRAFLDWTGYRQLHELDEAGGLDALFVEPGTDTPRENNGSKALTIATNRGDQIPVEARLFTSPWEGESALVLMLSGASGGGREKSLEASLQDVKADLAEARAILDTATDGAVVFGGDGRILTVSRGAEALFGYDGPELAGLPFESLFAPDSRQAALDYVARVNEGGVGSVLNGGSDVNGRTRTGSDIALFMTVGRIAERPDRLCAVFRDITPWKTSESELRAAKRTAEQASLAKSEFLAKVSHEIRTPLNAIIGFSEVMMQERFGPVGNERYKQYLKDIHASGGHLVSLLNDLLDLSKIEAGRLELDFSNVDLNDITQQCVGLMQAQANRERIIVRTSLSPSLQPVVADMRSVKQIVLNLLSNSIKFTEPGGQVIVSTAPGDRGEVVLRVRDTGIGMSEQDIAVALEPFRQLATTARWNKGGTGLGLPLTKALAEANRASFRIKSAVNAGTLVEVAFHAARVAAE
ncbi:MAG: PAS domain S-box protein [Alphaproteobacteria bacterium]|nr:PAS domain S-box protein [Alphaproteobacteria bacterium]